MSETEVEGKEQTDRPKTQAELAGEMAHELEDILSKLAKHCYARADEMAQRKPSVFEAAQQWSKAGSEFAALATRIYSLEVWTVSTQKLRGALADDDRT